MTVQLCPTREELSGYVLGTLPEEAAETVAEHIETCSACETTVQELEREGDFVLQGLRRPALAIPGLDSPEYEQAIAAVESLGQGLTGADKSTDELAEQTVEFPQLGEYELLEKLGEGGMGAVYKARHSRLKRIVAVKLLPQHRTSDSRAVARFEREMEAVGRLDHPNIVRAYDARDIDGTMVLVMEYVDGLDLGKLVHRVGSLRIPDACELVHQTALGLQYAHEHGLVHRDIKPSNLVLECGALSPLLKTPAPATPSAATQRAGAVQPSVKSGDKAPHSKTLVKILDFGLALLDTDRPRGEEMTAAGTAMGTADYVSPEQVTDSHAVDIRSDIYSLGCTLYKLLSGRAPFVGPEYKKDFQKMMAHVHDVPSPISLLRTDLPPELVAIIERMMAKAPADRFAEPAEVATALAPFAADCDLAALAAEALGGMEAPSAAASRTAGTDKLSASPHTDTASPLTPAVRGEGPGVRGGFGGRRVWLALAAAAAAIPLLFGVWVIIRDKSGKEVGRMQVPEGGSVEQVDDQGRPVKDVRASQKKPTATTKGSPAKQHGDMAKGSLTFATTASVPLPDSPLSGLKLVTNPAPMNNVKSWTIVPRPQIVTAPIQRESPPWLTPLSPHAWADPLGDAMSPDGRRAAFVGHDGSLMIFYMTTSTVSGVLYPHYPVARVTWSRDGRLIAARGMPTSTGRNPGNPVSCEESIDVWEVETGRLLQRFEGKTTLTIHWLGLLAFSNDSKLLAVNRWETQRSSVDILSLQTGECIKSLTVDDPALLGNLIGLAWSPDDSRVLAGVQKSGKAETMVCRVDTGEIERRIPDVSASPLFSPDGTRLAIGGWELRTRFFLWPGLDRFAEVQVGGANAWTYPRLWIGDGKRLWAEGGFARFQIEPSAVPKASELGKSLPERGQFVVDEQGRPCFFGIEGNGVVLIDLESHEKRLLATIPPRSPGGPVTYAASETERVIVSPYDFASYRFEWSADRRWFADASSGDEIQVWDAPAGKLAYRLRGEKPAQRIALAPDGKWLAAADADGTLALWDVSAEKVGRNLFSTTGAKSALAFSPDGRLLAAGGQSLELFEVATGNKADILPINVAGTGRLIVWNADSRQLTARAADGTLQVVDTGKGAVVQTLRGHSTSGAFSNDGRLFASREDTGVIRVTDLTSGRLESVLHFGDDAWLAVSANGHYCGNQGVEDEIAYLVETAAGRELLNPAEFSQRYGWKNDRTQVRCRGDAPPRRAVAKTEAPPQVKVKQCPQFSPLEWCAESGQMSQQLCSQLPDGTTWTLAFSKPQRHKVVRFSPNSEMVAVGSGDNWIRVYDQSLSLRLMVPGSSEFAFAPDSRLLAVALPGRVAVFEVGTGKGVFRLECPRSSYSVSWSPHGQMLATGDEAGCVRRWSVETGSLFDTLVHPSPADRVSWSPSGEYLSVSTNPWRTAERSLEVLWDSAASVPVGVFDALARRLDSAWSRDDKLAVSSVDGYSRCHLLLWSGHSRRVLASDFVYRTVVSSLAWSPDGRQVVADRTVRSVPGWGIVRELENPATEPDVMASVAWSPDGTLIALGAITGDVFLYRPNVSTSFRSLGTPSLAVNYNAFAAPTHWSRDGSGPLPQGGMPFSRIREHGCPLVNWSRQGNVVCVQRGKEVELVDAKIGQATTLRVGDVETTAAAFSADGKTLALRLKDCRVELWNVTTREIRCQLNGPIGAGFTVSPDGSLAASVTLSEPVTVRVHDAATGAIVISLPNGAVDAWCHSIAFSPDGTQFAALDSQHLHVFDVATWKETRRIPSARARPENLSLLAWLADGVSLAYSHDSSELRIVDSRSGELLRSMKDLYLDAALFNRDASLLVAPDWSGAVLVFETATGKLRHSFTTYADGQWVAMSPDGHWCGSPGMEQYLVHIVQTPQGQQLLSPAEFAAKYGWKNDPSKVQLPLEPSVPKPDGSKSSPPTTDQPTSPPPTP